MNCLRLVFPLPQVLELAQHAIAAPGHKKSFLDHEYGTTPAPALWFVGDDGLYLMSNGLPARPGPADPSHMPVVYAHGYRTAAAKHAVDAQIGGDDFSEVLILLDPQSDGPSLHSQLTAGAAAGATRLVIDIDRTRMDLYVDDPRGRAR
jgi:hypothetical protein